MEINEVIPQLKRITALPDWSQADPHKLERVLDVLRDFYRQHKVLHGIEPDDEVKSLIRELFKNVFSDFMTLPPQFAMFALTWKDSMSKENAAHGLADWFYNHSFLLHGKSPFEWFVCYAIAEAIFDITSELEMQRTDF